MLSQTHGIKVSPLQGIQPRSNKQSIKLMRKTASPVLMVYPLHSVNYLLDKSFYQ